MAKWMVMRGKIIKHGEYYRKGDIVELPVAKVKLFPNGMVERVPDVVEPEPVPEPEPVAEVDKAEEPEPEPIEEPIEEPEPDAKPERMTI